MIKKAIMILLLLFSIVFTENIIFNTATAQGTDLTQPDFEIDTGVFTPGEKNITNSNGSLDAVSRANDALGVIIQKLMLTIGGVSLLIMSVGAGYIIIAHGQDDILSKGKQIFIAGAIGLIVSLLSYYMVSILRYLIYNSL